MLGCTFVQNYTLRVGGHLSQANKLRFDHAEIGKKLIHPILNNKFRPGLPFLPSIWEDRW